MSRERFQPSGLITLSTDFGLADPFVGLMKAVIYARFPGARIVDFSHALSTFDPAIAGFWLARSWPYCPAGTVHLAIVDPGVGGDRAMKCLQLADQVFVAPDNGLLDELEQLDTWQFSRRFTLSDLTALKLGPISRTFHGRDVFAPLVAELAAGRVDPATLGTAVMRPSRPAAADSRRCLGQVRAIDHFGNVLTDIAATGLADFRNPVVAFSSQLIEIKDTYSSFEMGELAALVNAFGVLELAVNQGSAAQRLAARIGMPVEVIEREHRLSGSSEAPNR